MAALVGWAYYEGALLLLPVCVVSSRRNPVAPPSIGYGNELVQPTATRRGILALHGNRSDEANRL